MTARTRRRVWGTGKVLAVVVPVCIAIIAAAVVLAVTLGKSDEGGGSAGSTSQEESGRAVRRDQE